MQLASFRIPPWPTYLHTYLHTYIHTYMHTYIHNTYIHTYMHTYILEIWVPLQTGEFLHDFQSRLFTGHNSNILRGATGELTSLPAFIWNTVVDLGDGTKYLGPYYRAVHIRRWDYLFKANVVRTILLSLIRVWLTYLWILGSKWPTICFLLFLFSVFQSNYPICEP